jgi:tripartite-type tricarboxylate transporter receptor subunit TctC
MASQCGRRNLRGRQGTALLLGLFLAAFALLPSAFRDLASAQGESRPITLVVGFPAGSGTLDAIARIMREWLTRKWMQPVIVDNIPGLSGSAGAETVFRAPPDGRTLLITPPGLLTIARHLQPLAFDPDQFVRVSLLATTPIVLVARRDLPAADLRELVAYAREHPGKLMAANQGQGSSSHLTAEWLRVAAALDIAHVPFRGSVAALQGLSDGRVDILFDNLGSSLEPIRNSRPTSPSRCCRGFRPSRKPCRDLRPRSGSALADLACEPVGSTPEATGAFIRNESERWKSVIKDAKIGL